MPDISHQKLRETLEYEPDSGLFKRLISLRGDRVGQYTASAPTPAGYVVVSIGGREYLAHRVAWFWMTGEWPSHPVDHINGKLNDNRWSNLRLLGAGAPAVTAERVREAFRYEPETGLLIRRISYKKHRIGKPAGNSKSASYVMVDIDQQRYLAHRLIWLYVYGEWPAGEIDHINGVRSDNRLSNLRVATRSQNSANRPAPKNNTSGVKGVHWHKQSQKWRVSIEVMGKKIERGEFRSLEAASAEFARAAIEYFGEFAHAD